MNERIFFDQLIRDNLDIGRPGRVSLIFDRKIAARGKRATPGRFPTRVITDGVTPSLHIDYKNSKIKQYHAAALAALIQPVISPAGTRTAEMPITSPRVQACSPPCASSGCCPAVSSTATFAPASRPCWGSPPGP